MSSPVAKLIVALLGGLAGIAGQVVTWGVVSAADKGWVSLVVALLTFAATTVSVYLVPNTPAKPDAPKQSA